MAAQITPLIIGLLSFNPFNIRIFVTKNVKFLLNQLMLFLILRVTFNVVLLNFKILFNVLLNVLENKFHLGSFLQLFASFFVVLLCCHHVYATLLLFARESRSLFIFLLILLKLHEQMADIIGYWIHKDAIGDNRHMNFCVFNRYVFIQIFYSFVFILVFHLVVVRVDSSVSLIRIDAELL